MSLQREQQTVPNGLWAAVACVASGAVVWIGCMYNNLQNEMLQREKEMKAIEVTLASSEKTLREVDKAVCAAARGNGCRDMEEAMRAREDLLLEKHKLEAQLQIADQRYVALVQEMAALRNHYMAQAQASAQMSRTEPIVVAPLDHAGELAGATLDSLPQEQAGAADLGAAHSVRASELAGATLDSLPQYQAGAADLNDHLSLASLGSAAGPEAPLGSAAGWFYHETHAPEALLDSAAGGSFHEPHAPEALLGSAAGGSLHQQHAPEARGSDLPQSPETEATLPFGPQPAAGGKNKKQKGKGDARLVPALGIGTVAQFRDPSQYMWRR